MLKIVFYTDGACLGNPGPMGIGIVAYYGNIKKVFSEYMGNGTNNRAELLAILKALQTVKYPEKSHVIVYSDSQWAINVLNGTYKAKVNLDLIQKIKEVAEKIARVEYIWIRGHNGHPDNEEADRLAQEAIKKAQV